ncbi:acyl-CoA dehydrogenase family protein [Paucibacter sediminis]|uniref:Acyl-[acyl-carrier-protein] dehydrogenase MbtN n=1 Tax=Paucibacter sediminis TaxID=3019553 RepID=A0AA95NBK0_9BURK|nr:acyl-CoA dehydrogenase family protein [Paucibacter sp. S2-9]WIT09752.1 acyl-CoA dehydrogenase family protein [Paucibacter sp. S2-9]
MSLPLFPSSWMNDEHRMLQDSVARFFKERWVPRAAEWREGGMMGRDTWLEAGANGLLCTGIPEAYGGGGGDFGHEAVILLEQAKANLSGFGGGLHSAIVGPYILHYGNEEQKARWLPRMARGELVGAIAMTEPGTGSDLQSVRTVARREGDEYVLSGQKVFITNGQNANLVVVVCKTDKSAAAKGISLLVVEVENEDGSLVPGYRRGRNLDKIGMKAQDTSELFFDEVRVPVANLLGGAHAAPGEGEGQGFIQLMQELPQERLIIAVTAVGAMERALSETLAYTKERKAFGKSVWDFQNTRFKLAEVQSQVLAARAFVDACMDAHLKGELDAARAALAKAWSTDLACKVMDECLQLFGGYGYMMEYPIAELYADARVARIYGGTNEIMKELASRFM